MSYIEYLKNLKPGDDIIIQLGEGGWVVSQVVGEDETHPRQVSNKHDRIMTKKQGYFRLKDGKRTSKEYRVPRDQIVEATPSTVLARKTAVAKLFKGTKWYKLTNDQLNRLVAIVEEMEGTVEHSET